MEHEKMWLDTKVSSYWKRIDFLKGCHNSSLNFLKTASPLMTNSPMSYVKFRQLRLLFSLLQKKIIIASINSFDTFGQRAASSTATLSDLRFRSFRFN